jgi:hypothetical protein
VREKTSSDQTKSDQSDQLLCQFLRRSEEE